MTEGIIQKVLRKHYGDIYRDEYIQKLQQKLIEEIKKTEYYLNLDKNTINYLIGDSQ